MLRQAVAALFLLLLTVRTLFAQVDVLTAQYGTDRTGSNTQETVLTQANVSSLQFGKLFSRNVDAGFYASPLVAAGVTIPGAGQRNVVYVATLANTVYAFDADNPAVASAYWSVNLGAAIARSGYYLGPTVGVMSTPVIDRSTNTIYVTAIVRTTATEAGLFVYALDLSTGAHKFNSPRRITYTFPSGLTRTNASQPGGSSWIQRAGLLVSNGLLYVATSNVWEDIDWIGSQEGFIQSFRADDLSVMLGSFETTPSGNGGGIWQAGRGIAADASGNVFVAMDSGAYHPTPPFSFGDSVVKFSGGALSPLSWFTPANWSFLYANNLDLSANGVTLMPGTSLAFAGGKEGVVYLLDQNNLGGLEAGPGTGPLQKFQAAAGCTENCGKHLSTAYWPHATNPRLYVWDVGDYLRAYPFDQGLQRFLPGSLDLGTLLPSRPSGLSVSSNGSAAGTGIVWATTAAEDPFTERVPGTLRAFNADDITQELYNSDENGCRDAMGFFVKMAPPIVANGKVYVNTQSGVLNVYGLLPAGTPGAVHVRASTSPHGLAVTVDGSSCADAVGAPGSQHTIATVSPQTGSPGTRHVWSSWSDGGAMQHTVAPTSDTTYTANFTTQYLLTAGAGAGSVVASPAAPGGYYDAGTSVQLTASAVVPGCTFSNWSGAATGSQNPLTIVMTAPKAVTANFQCSSFLTGFALDSPPQRNNFGGFVGMKFTVGSSPLAVMAVGRLALAGNTGSHVVKFVRANDGADVAGGSATVSMAGAAPGQFKYATLANPITLQANTSYYLVSEEFVGGDTWYDYGTLSSTGGVVNNAIWWNGTGWALSYANTSYVPPNFVFTTNALPVVTMNAPAGGPFTAPAEITLTANATDSDGNVTGVQFFANGTTLIGTGSGTNPSTITWTPVAAGSYTVTAKATDSALATTTSNAVTVTVSGPGGGTPGGVTFVKTDTTSQGSWRQTYGTQGYRLVSNATSLPATIVVTPAGHSSWTWAGLTSDPRALQAPAGSNRVAATEYAAGSFTLDVSFTDGLNHQLALYLLDWDNAGRVQTVEVLNATGTTVLDTRTISGFAAGQYLVWQVSGQVKIRFTRIAGPNAAVSGLFVDAAGGAPANVPPGVTMNPPVGGPFTAPATITLTANATDSDGTVGSVQFFANDTTLIGTGSGTNPSTISWTPVAGSYSVTAKATDNAATTTTSNAVTVVVSPPSGGGSLPDAATYIRTDTTSQGNWRQAYGTHGYRLVSNATSLPASIVVTPAGQSAWTWAGASTDVRALQAPAGSNRVAATEYATGSFTLDLALNDGVAHQVALYLLDWDHAGRVQTVDVLDSTGTTVLDTRTVSGFAAGHYLVWQVSGHVKFRLTRVAGHNAVVSGLFVDPASGTPSNVLPTVTMNVPEGGPFTTSAPITLTANAHDSDGDVTGVQFFANGTTLIGTAAGTNPATFTWIPVVAGTYSVTAKATDNASGTATSNAVNVTVAPPGGSSPDTASFVKSDTTTQGSWRQIYGAGGYRMVNNGTSLPPSVTITLTGQSSWTWNGGTSELRALQAPAGTNRVAATEYAGSSFTFDVTFTDGISHQLALYLLDWDNLGRVERVDVLDPTGTTILDTRTVSGFSAGQYLVWQVTGHVKIRITRLAGSNAVVSGLFVD